MNTNLHNFIKCFAKEVYTETGDRSFDIHIVRCHDDAAVFQMIASAIGPNGLTAYWNWVDTVTGHHGFCCEVPDHRSYPRFKEWVDAGDHAIGHVKVRRFEQGFAFVKRYEA